MKHEQFGPRNSTNLGKQDSQTTNQDNYSMMDNIQENYMDNQQFKKSDLNSPATYE